MATALRVARLATVLRVHKKGGRAAPPYRGALRNTLRKNAGGGRSRVRDDWGVPGQGAGRAAAGRVLWNALLLKSACSRRGRAAPSLLDAIRRGLEFGSSSHSQYTSGLLARRLARTRAPLRAQGQRDCVDSAHPRPQAGLHAAQRPAAREAPDENASAGRLWTDGSRPLQKRTQLCRRRKARKEKGRRRRRKKARSRNVGAKELYSPRGVKGAG